MAPQLRPRWIVCWQVLFCSAPPAFFIYTGQLGLAVLSFYGLLGALSFYYTVRNEIVHVTALFLGSVPMLMMLRPVFYYNSISIFFGALLLLWLIAKPGEIRHLMRDSLVFPMLPFALGYWWYSFFTTGAYSSNIAVFELVFGACLAFLLGRFRSYWSGALWGLSGSTVILVAGVWRYGEDRLGMAEVGTTSLGHPQQVGMAAALLVILSLADEGRWLGLGRSVFWRFATAAVGAGLLLVTTSRTSWLLTLLGVAAILVGRGRKAFLVPAAVLIGLVVVVVMSSSRGAIVMKYIDKLTAADRTLSQKTSGRLDMYNAFPRLFWQAPLTGLGPGAAENAYRDRSGDTFQLHSLFLHVGVELGALGLGALLFAYCAIVRRTWIHRRFTGEIAPLSAALCCWVDGLAHNSFNPLTGIFLGLALTDLSRWRVLGRSVTSNWRRVPVFNPRPALQPEGGAGD